MIPQSDGLLRNAMKRMVALPSLWIACTTKAGTETIAGIGHFHGQLEETSMARTSNRLPERFPVGSKYVVESCGPVVRRYVEFPDGHKVTLPKRRALSCTLAGTRYYFAADHS